MNLTIQEIECLAAFLSEHHRTWKAYARIFKVDGDNLPREISRLHAHKVEQMTRSDRKSTKPKSEP